MLILGIETSCDETAASVVSDGKVILSNIVLSQIKLHKHFSGVVPEIACRAHTNWIVEVIEKALLEAKVCKTELNAIAVTTRPGLIGALLIGLSAAKALAYSLNIPLIAVDHLQGHLYAAVMNNIELKYPFIGVVASGGHTSIFFCKSPTETELLGSTTDDAVGECFDKVSKLLNLGYPGGPAISKRAEGGNHNAIRFPRTLLGKDSLNFSFSGLKTAVYYYVNGQPGKKERVSEEKLLPVEDICASVQEAIVEVLVEKTLRAAVKTGIKQIAITGGVASNKRLREKLSMEALMRNIKVFFPSPELCTDNAAMIAGLGYEKYIRKETVGLSEDAYAQADYKHFNTAAKRKR